MSKGHAALKFLRKVHLYLVIFTTPALLFFAITGALQIFSMHETTQGSNDKPQAWIRSLAQLHKKQTTQVPPRRARPVGRENAPETAARRYRFARSCDRPDGSRQSNAIRTGGAGTSATWAFQTAQSWRSVGAIGFIGSAEESFADEDLLSSGLPEPRYLYADWHLYVL
jgi:hypothetical protein